MTRPQHDPLAWIDGELNRLDEQRLRRQLAVSVRSSSTEITRNKTSLINFGSNDYLAIASDPRLMAAASETATSEGWGSGASPLVCGRTQWHARLERRLAEFEGCEAALLFPSGFAAGAGTIPALVDRQDAIFGDEKNHASLIDGCRLSRAQIHIYPHGDTDSLEQMLADAGDYRRRLIVTDALFSMDGNLAPLQELAALRTKYDAMLMVDEAHATGVFGTHGRGVAEHLGVEDRVDVRVGTLSKALGSAGGFIVGRRTLIDWLANTARSYIFSTAPPAATCAAGLAALDIVLSEPERRKTLLHRAGALRDALQQQGWDTGASASQIIPIQLGDPHQAMQMSEKLAEEGFYVPGIRPPSVPTGQSLLRLSLSYGHTPDAIERFLATMKSLNK